MISKSVFFIVALLSLSSSTPFELRLTIGESSTLTDVLCKQKNDALILTVLANVTYMISHSGFCDPLNTNGNITLRSNSAHQSATIVCSKGFGLMLSRSMQVSIHNIVFKECGAHLSDAVIADVNDSMAYFYHHSTTMLFKFCSHIELSRVTISDYNGFGIVAANTLVSASLNRLIISNNSQKSTPGSGVLIYFTNNSYVVNHTAHVTFTSCTFKNNTNLHSGQQCQQSIFLEDKRR